MDAHYKACLYAGLRIAGTNCETMPGQWEYQIGPSPSMEACDHLWLSRYLLARVSEDFGITISLEPKLFKDFNGAGAHINYSTKTMREGTQGMKYIWDIIEKLEKRHKIHLQVYGDNSKRLTGHHETSEIDHFTAGVGDRGASVRIPTTVARDDGKGYIEDRRPASDMDPYAAIAAIVATTLNNGDTFDAFHKAYLEWKEWKKTADIEEA